MKVYAAHKNDEIIKGKLFALPEQAFIFFCDEWGIKTYVSNPQDIQEG